MTRHTPVHHFQPPCSLAFVLRCTVTFLLKEVRRSFSRSQYSLLYSSQFSRNSGLKDLGSRRSMMWSPPGARSSSMIIPFSCSTRCHSVKPPLESERSRCRGSKNERWPSISLHQDPRTTTTRRFNVRRPLFVVPSQRRGHRTPRSHCPVA